MTWKPHRLFRNRSLGLVAFVCVTALPAAASAQLLFEDQPNALPQGCNGSGCWTNYARMTDLDGDGDLDLVGVNCGNFFGTSPQPLLVWTNDGEGAFTTSNMLGNIVAPLRQIAIGDVDGDDDADVYIPSAGNVQADRLLIQNAPGVFADEASARLPAGLSSDAGFTRMGDLDGDGDLDLIVGGAYSNAGEQPAYLFFNDGAGNFTASTTSYPLTALGSNPDDVDLADLDGDFDLDVLINVHEGQNEFWINDGAGNFVTADAPTLALDHFHYGPVFCDVDGDDDLDMFVDNDGVTGDFLEQLALNDGAGNFTDASDQISGNIDNDDNLIACVDFDDDGDFDILIGALNARERVFRNDGSGNFTPVSNAFDGPQDPTLWLELGDVNGDNRLDVFTVQGEQPGGERDRVYFGTADRAADSKPPTVRIGEDVTLSPTEETVVRFALSDNATTDEGARLSKVFVLVGATEVPARYMGGDLYRAVLPASDETSFKICAVDLAGNAIDGCPGGTGEGGGSEGGSGPQGGNSNNGGNGANGGSSNNGGAGASGGAGSDSDSGSDDGCGCALPGSSRTDASHLFALAALGLTLITRAQRRRR